MATPVVSGAVADILQARPTLTPDQVKALIMQTAYKTFPTSSTAIDPVSGTSYISYYDIFTIGAGYLDMQAALGSGGAVPANAVALSFAAVYDGSTGNVTLSVGSSSIWATRTVWGTQSVWGSAVISGNRCVWGTRTVWGTTSSTSASRTVWGTQAIWSSSSIYAASTQDAGEAASIAILGEQ